MLYAILCHIGLYCNRSDYYAHVLTHWGRVMHICVNKLTIIGSDNGLLPDRHQAIIWINAGILLIEPLGTNFSEIFSGIHTFLFKKMHLKMSSRKFRPFYLELNVLMISTVPTHSLSLLGTRTYRWVSTRCNSSALAMELRLSCTNPSICRVMDSSGLLYVRHWQLKMSLTSEDES